MPDRRLSIIAGIEDRDINRVLVADLTAVTVSLAHAINHATTVLEELDRLREAVASAKVGAK